MLNIDEIRAIRRQDPEPDEVKEMRERIRSSFDKLEFVEDGHKYYLPRGNGEKEELSSVSAFIHQFEPKKDWDEITQKYADKHGMTFEQVKRMWHENNIRATTHGTVIHGFAEAYFYFITDQLDQIPEPYRQQLTDGYLIPYGPKQMAAARFWEDVVKVKGLYPLLAETKVYSGMNDKYHFRTNYAGTFDLSFALKHKGEWGVLVYDYKGLPLDTPLATPDGWTTMGEVKEGDTVFDKDGKPTKVLHTSEIHHKPCMKISFVTGETIVADEDHRWLVHSPHTTIEGMVLTTREIAEKAKSGKFDEMYIIDAKTIQCEDKELLIDPYTLGQWLSGKSVGEDCDDVFKSMVLTSGMRIPTVYMRAGYEQRWRLMEGLMDGCGDYLQLVNLYFMEVKTLNLADDCVKLLATLGIKSIINDREGKYFVEFKTVNKLKQNNYPSPFDGIRPNTFPVRYIAKVEETETVPTRCIEVDSPTHTFCCGHNMLVTHNTNAELSSSYNRSYDVRLLPPFDDFIEEAQSLYTLQLSAYSLAIKQLDYPIHDRKLIWLKDTETYEKISLPDVSERLRDFLENKEEKI